MRSQLSDHDDMMEILADAVELPVAERTAFLDHACADTAMRAEIDRLLRGEQSAAKIDTRYAHSEMARALEPPSRIGPYRIVRELGHGGMGAVYLAMQRSPVKRPVAIKLLLPGIDTREVLKRFESERQALALMSHPNVAQVYDAGVTDTGRPYFVMEYIDGPPITEFCDAERFTTVARLELFLQVCQAVEHAHQKAIIHRDLKPSNVLVVHREGHAIPKVIDFGIAKAIDSSTTAHTAFTEHGQLVGTPEYMSPEQASAGAIDVDTRSDVYCLGVLLYELLTGSLPFHRDALRHAANDEIRRIIREVEPPKPSTRLSGLDSDVDRIATARQSNPAGLRRSIRGDLDWITMRAMEKDRSRRYASPAEMADDLRRHLRDETVRAGPPTQTYRVRKFVRRHRTSVAVAALLGVSMLAGIATTSWQAVRARQARQVALEQKAIAERRFADVRALSGTFIFDIDDAIVYAGPTKAREKLVQIAQRYLNDLSKEAGDDGALMTDVMNGYLKVGNVQFYPGSPHLGDPTGANESYGKALQIALSRSATRPSDSAVLAQVGVAHIYLGHARQALNQLEEALQSFAAARAVFEDLTRREPNVWRWPRNVALVFDNEASVYRTQGDGARSLKALKQCEDVYERLAAANLSEPVLQRDVLVVHAALASLYLDMGLPGESLSHARRSAQRAIEIAALDPANPAYQRDVPQERQRLCEILLTIGRCGEALELMPSVVRSNRLTLTNDPSNILAKRDLANTLSTLGTAYRTTGQFREAMNAYTESIALREAVLKTNPDDWQMKKGIGLLNRCLAMCCRATGTQADAAEYADKSLTIFRDRSAQFPDSQAVRLAVSFSERIVGEIAFDRGEFGVAIDHLRTARDFYAVTDGTDPNPTDRRELVAVLASLGRALAADGRNAEARPIIDEGVKLASAILSIGNTDDVVRTDYLRLLLLAADGACRQSDFAQANTAVDVAAREAAILISSDSLSLDFRQSIAACAETRGDVLASQHLPAADAYRQAIDRWKEIELASPDLKEAKVQLKAIEGKLNESRPTH
jgi:eukaryotic-like serine/threonine-protein kinase